MTDTPYESNKPKITTDFQEISPETVIEKMTEKGVIKTLGNEKDTLYIGHRTIKLYSVEDYKVYIWSDNRSRENSIFISKEYVGRTHEVSWYIGRKIAVKTIMKVIDQRDFIEKCVRTEIAPESLKQ